MLVEILKFNGKKILSNLIIFTGELEGEDSSNSKMFRNTVGTEKKGTNKDSTDNDIMVREL